MYADQDLEEVQYDLNKPTIAVSNHTRRFHKNTDKWCNLKLALRKGLQFHQTRSHAIALFNTLPAICIEKVVFMKTGEVLHCRVFQSPRLPRVILTPNLQHGRQDPSNPEARTSANHQSKRSAKHEETRRTHLEESRRAKYEETHSGNVDHTMQCVPHSAVQKKDSDRKDIVKD